MKKLRILLVIVLCLVVCLLVLREIMVRNVFDEMYYGHSEVNNHLWTQASYRGIMDLSYSRMLPEFKVPGYISESFRGTLIEDTQVGIKWYLERELLEIQVSLVQKWDEDDGLYRHYRHY